MLCVHSPAGCSMVYGREFSYELTACLLEHRSRGLGSLSMWSNSAMLRVCEWLLWTIKYPPSCSRQENIYRCLPRPIHTNKWAKWSRTAPEYNSDSLFIPSTSRNVELFLPCGKKNKTILGQILPKGCLARGVFLSVFDAPGDLRPISMFCKLPNVVFSQNSVHLATLTLTPSFSRSPCWFSDCMFSLPQQGPEKLLLKSDLKLQGVLRLCFPEILT